MWPGGVPLIQFEFAKILQSSHNFRRCFLPDASQYSVHITSF